MAISRHESLQSLALYTRVREDEKMMMDLKLTFSLLKPEEARELMETNEETNKDLEPKTGNEEPARKK